MPINNTLKPAKLPMVQKWNQKPKTRHMNNLGSIVVSLIDCPTVDQLRSYLPQYLEATWAEYPDEACFLSTKEKDDIIRKCFEGKALPTALETISLTFKIDGISLQEVTHLIRHRTGSFSADCSGDKWWSDKDSLVPFTIQQSPDFYERFQKVVEDSKQLYQDMIDSKEISIMDARYILTRNLSTFYFVRFNIKDAIAFINQRQDKQIQPETDNIIAYQMACKMLEKIPYLYDLFDFHKPSMFYTKMARSGKATNLYFPDEDSDVFEYNSDDFIYQKKRSDFNGTKPKVRYNLFKILFEAYCNDLEKLNFKAKRFLGVED